MQIKLWLLNIFGIGFKWNGLATIEQSVANFARYWGVDVAMARGYLDASSRVDFARGAISAEAFLGLLNATLRGEGKRTLSSTLFAQMWTLVYAPLKLDFLMDMAAHGPVAWFAHGNETDLEAATAHGVIDLMRPGIIGINPEKTNMNFPLVIQRATEALHRDGQPGEIVVVDIAAHTRYLAAAEEAGCKTLVWDGMMPVSKVVARFFELQG